MTRGYSLEQDLKLLINNQKYSDVEILCQDGKELHACRAILAARSEVFDSLLYNGMKETFQKQISFPKINSSGMKIILEYIYTGSIKGESLNKDNIVESFCAADFFQLPDLQDIITMTTKDILKNDHTKNYSEDYSPELLSKIVDRMLTSEDNDLLNLLVEAVATIPLNTIEFGRLSNAALQYLLYCTHEKEKPFVTPEYEVFRYSAILSAKRISNDAYETLMKRLLTSEALEQTENSPQIENDFFTDHQKVAEELEPLIKFIDFRRINGQILADIIEPLRIIPANIVVSAYRYMARSNGISLSNIRGIQSFNLFSNKSAHIWDKSACGSKLIIEDDGEVVQASSDCNSCQSVRANMIFGNKGIYEWDVIIEKVSSGSRIGVCASENFDYDTWTGDQFNGWVLGSNGCCYNDSKSTNYCSSFVDGAKITVHLNMNDKTIAFTVNGTKYPNVSVWDNLPSKLYPVVSLRRPGRLRIQNFRKS